MVMSPASLPFSSISGSFSTRCFANREMTSPAATPTFAVTRFSEVITSFTNVVWRSKPETKRMSRLVMMPTKASVGVDDGEP